MMMMILMNKYLHYCRWNLLIFSVQKILKSKFLAYHIFNFCKNHMLASGWLSNFITHTQQVVIIFYTTYCYEQLFKMKHTKSTLYLCSLHPILLMIMCYSLPDSVVFWFYVNYNENYMTQLFKFSLCLLMLSMKIKLIGFRRFQVQGSFFVVSSISIRTTCFHLNDSPTSSPTPNK